MIILTRLALVCVLIGALVYCSTFYRQSDINLEVAPDFSLPSLDGGRYSLSSAEGKYILLHFWSTWCVSCVTELESLHNLYRYLNSDEFEIVAIAIDDTWEEVNKVRKKHNLSFPMLIDREGMARDSYKVSGLPQSMLIDKSRRFISFREPESGKLVSRTSTAQRWDEKEAARHFMELINEP